MARHSEEECAYCEGDILPLSYIVGADDQLYCSVKCADLGERGRGVNQAAAAQAAGTGESEAAHA